MKRKLKLTITRIYRQTVPAVFRAPCPVCGCEVEMLTTGEAARFLQINETALANLVAAGNVHAALTVGGNSRVCKNSLFQY